MRTVFVAATLFVAATASFAQTNVVGAWKGRMIFDKRLETAGKTKEEKAAIKASIAQGAKITIAMMLNKDKTFTVTVNFPDKTKQVSVGTWRQKGDEVTTRTLKRDGKAVPTKEQKDQTMKLDKAGKQMVRFFEEQPGVGVIFVR